ncbi:hypothetical protein [Mucilaginibacter sp. SP1R1]|uniref:hypothetical protein n=1 Tax=Mucilaginibacter sp. SP1R1 TaxID=2723091 RepID=UPI00161C2606|nr:hypothetical protein [Mucilaginibacter sp. SP1R1]MBB6149221.1 hypothetical protein [Mucilaginibacter sp. SP1R1]
MHAKNFTLLISLLFISGSLLAQQATNTTAEDSLNNNSLSNSISKSSTSIGGYGNAFYQYNSKQKTAKVDLERFVLFVGHKFNDKISFFSETEVEDAKVVGGQAGGEITIEQAYLKFNLNANQYIVAGLFLPRIGILNENHLPNTFNGNERNYVETLIIPSTWRELGIGLYGRLNNLPINYSLGLVNGLSAAGFSHGTGIVDGRFEGRNATGTNLAVTGSLQFYQNNFRAQVAGYYGGTVGIRKTEADSLGLNSGVFGTPVAMGEGDIQYNNQGVSVKVLGTIVSIPDAANINRAYASNTPKTEYGAYAELGYDLFYRSNYGKTNPQQLIVFVRDEKLDLNASIPENGITDGTLNQNHVIAGLTYLPIRNVVVKADVRIIHSGKQNPDLIINPSPVALPYQTSNNLVNLGVGYSF